jgi:arabinose-5-phosphate isomerase
MKLNIVYDYQTDEARRPDPQYGQTLDQVRQVFTDQASSIAALAKQVDESFFRAVDLLINTDGHVIVSGMGKSGLIGKKIAATLSSTGTPAFFLHPGEAYHGDLGMITPRDTIILVSYSGETEEVTKLLPHLEDAGVSIISLVGRMDSTLAKGSKVALDCAVEREVCPNNLAPTSSTMAAMAMGDALAVSLIHARDFKARDFAKLHPGGSLGRRLLTRVRDVMNKGTLPVATPDQNVRETLLTMTRGRHGIVLVMEGNVLKGVVTDGDLRRALQKFDDVLDVPLWRIMTTTPKTIREDALLSEAEERMLRAKIKTLVVTNDRGEVTGVVDFFEK